MHNALAALLQRLSGWRRHLALGPDLDASSSRLLLALAGLSLAVGLTFGLLAVGLWSVTRPTSADSLPVLDSQAQSDYIILAAESFYADQDLRLAQDRLARLGAEQSLSRVEALAVSYASDRDVIASRLAALAVSLGSTNRDLVALNRRIQPAQIAELSAELGGMPLAPAEEPVPAPPPTALPTSAPAPTDAPALATPAAAQAPSVRQATLPRVDQSVLPAIDQDEQPGRRGRPPTATPLAAGPAAQDQTAPGTAPAAPSARPTAAPVKNPIVARAPVNLPVYVGAPSSSVPLTARPARCTPASQIGAAVDHTLTLCAGQEYAPFQVQGDNITIYGDHEGTAIIRAPPRGFGIRASGTNIAIVGVHVRGATDPADLNSWLCFYESCSYKSGTVRGGIAYGGGILLDRATHSAVASSTVLGGTIGIAVNRGANNTVVDNTLSDLNGWGVLLLFTNENHVVGNTLRRINRPCLDPDGNYLQNGCESSGVAAIKVNDSVFFKNHCEHSGNCYYASGVGGYASNNNRFYNNYCAAATANCFEATFSRGNRFDYNVATSDADSHEPCIYPFWIGGSIVQFGSHNSWSCKFSAAQSLKEAQQTPDSETAIEGY